VKKKQNGRESLRRLKPTVGCNASKRRRSYGFENDKYFVFPNVNSVRICIQLDNIFYLNHIQGKKYCDFQRWKAQHGSSRFFLNIQPIFRCVWSLIAAKVYNILESFLQ
jgi:hypothetical protein